MKNLKIVLIGIASLFLIAGIVSLLMSNKTYTASDVFRGNFSAEGGTLSIVKIDDEAKVGDERFVELPVSAEQQYELLRLLEQAEYKKIKGSQFGKSEYFLDLKSPSVHTISYNTTADAIHVQDGDEAYKINDDGAFKKAFDEAVKQ